jgi:hypothetical protein
MHPHQVIAHKSTKPTLSGKQKVQGGFLHGEPQDGFACWRHKAYGLVNDDCGVDPEQEEWGLNRNAEDAEVAERDAEKEEMGIRNFPNGICSVAGGVRQIPNGIFHVSGGIRHFPNVTFHVTGAIRHFPNGIFHVTVAIRNFPNGIFHVTGAIRHFPNGIFHVAGGVRQIPITPPRSSLRVLCVLRVSIPSSRNRQQRLVPILPHRIEILPAQHVRDFCGAAGVVDLKLLGRFFAAGFFA